MKPLSERIKDFPADQFVDWLCLSCVDVREVRNEKDAQDEINKIRKAVTERLTALEKQRVALLGGFEEAIRHKDKLAAELNAVAAENASIKANVAIHAAGFSVCPVCSHEEPSETDDIVWMVKETPATDAYLNSVRAEGIHFAANRILAAWKSCLIKATPAEAADVSGAVLSALEFLPKANPEEFKRDYADQVRADIAELLRAGKDGE